MRSDQQRERAQPFLPPSMIVPIDTVCDWRLPDDEFRARFRLPRQQDKRDRLREEHPLPGEDRIVFLEEDHKYFVDGRRDSIGIYSD